MQILRTLEFSKDLKNLSKRFRSLEEDLQIFIRVQLTLFHKHGIDNQGIVPISGLSVHTPKMFKAKKFACKALKGKGAKSGIRIIYAYFQADDRIELVEMYYKGDQENEDRHRIEKLYFTPR
ncbi:MAG: hypothetical protein KGQ49_03330 [Verrucomicrobia bacterium]|nr:hypothetical protein [Verrucomicrobiota bacterium]MBU6446414.1 hypothetical protein [Verrucomicrobiota bacterium]MDE3047526.1 hypothetical protein [Verrucomicrobiota bacterium]